MIVKSRLRTDPRNQEILPERYEALSYVCMKTVLREYPDGYFLWHWHDAFEIDYLLNGQVQVHTPEQTERFSQGDVVFINSGISHEYQAMDDSPCEIIAFLFDMHFLSGISRTETLLKGTSATIFKKALPMVCLVFLEHSVVF